MKKFVVALSVRISYIEAESEDDAINAVIETIEDEFGTFGKVEFDNQIATEVGE